MSRQGVGNLLHFLSARCDVNARISASWGGNARISVAHLSLGPQHPQPERRSDGTRAGHDQSIVHAKAGSEITHEAYRYDANGNRTEQKEANGAVTGNAEEATTYVYDTADRLTDTKTRDRSTHAGVHGGTCHLLRYTMATQMLEHGADIRFIQEMLGHAKLDTTQVYTHVSIAKLKAVHSATHPGAKLTRRIVER